MGVVSLKILNSVVPTHEGNQKHYVTMGTLSWRKIATKKKLVVERLEENLNGYANMGYTLADIYRCKKSSRKSMQYHSSHY